MDKARSESKQGQVRLCSHVDKCSMLCAKCESQIVISMLNRCDYQHLPRLMTMPYQYVNCRST